MSNQALKDFRISFKITQVFLQEKDQKFVGYSLMNLIFCDILFNLVAKYWISIHLSFSQSRLWSKHEVTITMLTKRRGSSLFTLFGHNRPKAKNDLKRTLKSTSQIKVIFRSIYSHSKIWNKIDRFRERLTGKLSSIFQYTHAKVWFLWKSQ